MADFGFWNLAQKDPDALALVGPDEQRLTAGQLLARANRLVHGLRALGLGKGDVVATVLPNSNEMIEIYLAALQAGFYLVPINHHLTASETAYILEDSGTKAFIGSDRFTETCAGAANEVHFPERARFALGRISGFRAWDELSAGQPDGLPADRTAGQVMNTMPPRERATHGQRR